MTRSIHYDRGQAPPEKPLPTRTRTTVYSVREAVDVAVRLSFERQQEMAREAAQRGENQTQDDARKDTP